MNLPRPGNHGQSTVAWVMRVFHCQNCGKAGLAVFQATTPGRPTLMVFSNERYHLIDFWNSHLYLIDFSLEGSTWDRFKPMKKDEQWHVAHFFDNGSKLYVRENHINNEIFKEKIFSSFPWVIFPDSQMMAYTYKKNLCFRDTYPHFGRKPYNAVFTLVFKVGPRTAIVMESARRELSIYLWCVSGPSLENSENRTLSCYTLTPKWG